MDWGPPGSSLPGILQARILEWVAISFSRASSDPGFELGSPTLQADSLLSEPPGKLLEAHRPGFESQFSLSSWSLNKLR